MSNFRKESAESGQKGPIRATLPVCRMRSGSSRDSLESASFFKYKTFSPPLRHISPDLILTTGIRSSPGSCFKRIGKSPIPGARESLLRRTASLDALFVCSSTKLTQPLVLHLNKSTQTEDTIFEGRTLNDSPVRQKYVSQSSLRTPKTPEHSTGCQTIISRTSPSHHVKASPVQIPSRACPASHLRPMRSSVEGLNQEIEKLVLYPSHPYRGRMELVKGTTPPEGHLEGHRAPLADLLQQQQSRTVNTQTPVRDFDTAFFAHLSSDESQGNSPGDEDLELSLEVCDKSNPFDKRVGKSESAEASPRINKFLAQKPPDGCERVRLKLNCDDPNTPRIIKPTVVSGFQLRPSLGSAFHQPVILNQQPRQQLEEEFDRESKEQVSSTSSQTIQGEGDSKQL